MSHRTVITSAYTGMFADPQVREKMSPASCAEVDAILSCAEWTPAQVVVLAFHSARVWRKPEDH